MDTQQIVQKPGRAAGLFQPMNREPFAGSQTSGPVAG